MKKRIGVFMGGLSSEKEVSLNSGRNVYDNLDRACYDPLPIFLSRDASLWVLPWQLVSQNTTADIEDRLKAEARKIAWENLPDLIDLAFLTLHGKYGEDGCVQGVFELLRLPYTGSGVMGSALGMDKHYQQALLIAADLDVPRSLPVTKEEWGERQEATIDEIEMTFSYPLVVKPSREGSSMGVGMVKSREELAPAAEAAFVWDRRLLVEEYLEGVEFSVIVIEKDAAAIPLGVTEIHPQSCFYTYDDKYMPGRCRKFTPPKTIPPEGVNKIKEKAVKAFSALGFRSYGRIDGFYLKEGRILITDPNSSSGMAPSSFFFEQAADAGHYPGAILTLLVEEAMKIHRGKRGPL